MGCKNILAIGQSPVMFSCEGWGKYPVRVPTLRRFENVKSK